MKNKPTDKILETDLYQPLYRYFTGEGYLVRAEVKDCDLTATKGDELLVVEMKLHFNATLLIQATQRQRAADPVYVAIPRPKSGKRGKAWHGMCHLLRRLELGLILVGGKAASSSISADYSDGVLTSDKSTGRHTLNNNIPVEVVFHPGPFDRAASLRRGNIKRKAILTEISNRTGDLNVGGSRGKKLVTAYRETAVHIACCMEASGPLSAAGLRKQYGTGDKTWSILTANHYGWFEKISPGVFNLTPWGENGLNQYAELAQHYRLQVKAATGSNVRNDSTSTGMKTGDSAGDNVDNSIGDNANTGSGSITEGTPPAF